MQRAARRERNRLKQYAERVANLGSSERMKAKAERAESYLDRIALDKLNGLEDGKICRDTYRARHRAMAARPRTEPATRSTRSRRKSEPRKATTYRWARKKLARGGRRSLFLKADRMRTGESRQDADRRRHQERQA